jgi:hypothetical protein
MLLAIDPRLLRDWSHPYGDPVAPCFWRSRPQVAPCLWPSTDVIRQLHFDFLGKCYLCESEMTEGSLQVDHRRPKADFPHLEHTWENLFPACAHCNLRRPRRYPDGDLLDPGGRCGLEDRLDQRARIEGWELTCSFAAKSMDDQPAHNTAKELQGLHDHSTGSTHQSRLKARDLLDAIQDRYQMQVLPLATRVGRCLVRGETPKDADLVELRLLLSRKSPYTMLLRSLVAELPGPSWGDFFD